MVFVKKAEAGFTLVEVMIAVLVLTVGLMSAAAMQTRAVEGSNAASRMTDRINAAEHWMEDIMARTIVAEGGKTVDGLLSDNCSGSNECANGQLFPAPAGSSYQVAYRVIPNSPLGSLVTIQVIATPTFGPADQRQRKQITFSYVRSNRWN